MKRLLIGFSILVSTVSSFAYNCEYGYRLDKVTIYQNYDNVSGIYKSKNVIKVTADNLNGQEINNSSAMGWVYDLIATTHSQTAINPDRESLLPLQAKDGKIKFKLTVVDEDYLLNPDDEIVNKDVSISTKNLSWSNLMYIRKNGMTLKYEIKKDCR